MFGKMTRAVQDRLWRSGRQVLCLLGVQPRLFFGYRNYLMRAARLTNPAVASYEDRQLLQRVHLERYVKMGYDRAVLVKLLHAVLTVRLPD